MQMAAAWETCGVHRLHGPSQLLNSLYALQALEQAAKKAKEELAASRRSHDTCQVTVKAVSADLDEHKSLLQEHRSLLEEHKAKLQRVLAVGQGVGRGWCCARCECVMAQSECGGAGRRAWVGLQLLPACSAAGEQQHGAACWP